MFALIVRSGAIGSKNKPTRTRRPALPCPLPRMTWPQRHGLRAGAPSGDQAGVLGWGASVEGDLVSAGIAVALQRSHAVLRGADPACVLHPLIGDQRGGAEQVAAGKVLIGGRDGLEPGALAHLGTELLRPGLWPHPELAPVRLEVGDAPR